MGRLVAIEGLDGAGKRTLTDALTAALREHGATVTTAAFPRYGRDVHADLVREALHGEHGDLAESVYGMALLYALDRRDAADELRAALAEHDVVLLDRYVASNAAYQAARLRQGIDGPVVRWVRETEVERFGLPVPDLHLLLRVPPEVAADRAANRARQDATRAMDAFESDDALQARCARVYDELAAANWLSEWHVVDGTEDLTGGPEATEAVAVLAKKIYLGK
ncbi:dTMP kinase [Saccharomonospora glauca]|jgi:dTMP kinase|uniref:Thymidylate kinase n=1 Tax=Saccharomonospora glauca K62 TaxID=928724 RepID=I1D5V5_9PSEU|nr:dTMP kinase [Saccharomonospora glauca]EIF00330.1 thymidylate kinase [Saccharomonospora glauca K62]